MKRDFYTISLVLLLLTGCKSASKLYEKGSYDEAVELAVKKIQKKPGDPGLISILQNAYQFAVDGHESRIRNLSSNNNELKWEWIYNEYASLQNLYSAIRRSPEAYRIIKAADYSAYLTTYAEKAADTRYERGMRWMERDDKLSFRNAYNEFNTALRFKPGDYTIKTRLDEAYRSAVVNVVVLPMENYRYQYSSYNDYSLRNFENELLRNLQYHGGNQFVKFYSEWDARGQNIRPDQFIDLRFTHFNTGRYHDEKSSREVSKDVVIKETVYRPDSVVKEYKKVFAKIITTRRTLYADGNMNVNIRDASGRWLWSDDFRGNYSWTTEFSTYTGDERALSETDKQLVNRRQDNPPHEDEIMRHIINEINNTLYSRIRDYFNRY